MSPQRGQIREHILLCAETLTQSGLRQPEQDLTYQRQTDVHLAVLSD